MTDKKGKKFDYWLGMLTADTKKPPEGGLIESGKMFSGIYPDAKIVLRQSSLATGM